MCYNAFMKSYYEYFRDTESELYVHFGTNPVYPPHFHAGVEVFILKKGFFTVTVGDSTINLSAGSIAVFDSYEVHSYDFKSQLEEVSAVLLIPYEFRKYLLPSEKHKILRHVINDGTLASTIFSLAENYLLSKPKSVQDGALNLICSLLKDNLSFTTESESDETDVLRKILMYICENYTGDVSRSKIALDLGYSESYISHVFNGYLKTNINTFVNNLRLQHVEKELKSGNNSPIGSLLYDAGFKSQQTYYRVKSKFSK